MTQPRMPTADLGYAAPPAANVRTAGRERETFDSGGERGGIERGNVAAFVRLVLIAPTALTAPSGRQRNVTPSIAKTSHWSVR